MFDWSIWGRESIEEAFIVAARLATHAYIYAVRYDSFQLKYSTKIPISGIVNHWMKQLWYIDNDQSIIYGQSNSMLHIMGSTLKQSPHIMFLMGFLFRWMQYSHYDLCRLIKVISTCRLLVFDIFRFESWNPWKHNSKHPRRPRDGTGSLDHDTRAT